MLAMLLCYCFTQPALLFADSPLVTLEIRYYMPEAGEVFLVWGINGWNVVPEEIRPAGTVEDGVMHTLMAREGDTFAAKVQVPAGATLDYGFQIRKTRKGSAISWVWDGDYRTTPSEDGLIEVKATLTLPKDVLSSVLDIAPYLLAGIGILLVTWLLILLSPGLHGTIKKGILIFAANVVPIVIVFYIGELYLRRLGFQPYVRTFPSQYQNDAKGVAWAQSDSVLGWTSNKTDPEINPQGFRDTKDFNTVDLYSGKTRVMVLGDSFIWGAGVRADENAPSLLQAKLKDGYEFFNLGVPGWGIDQMYLAYQQYKDVVEPDIVILAFIDDDVKRVLEAYRTWEGMNKPSFAVRDGELVFRTSISKSQLLLNQVMAKSVFFSLIMHEIYLLKDARPIVKHIFLNMGQETHRRGEKLVIVRIPTRDTDPIQMINRGLHNFDSVLKDTDVLYLAPSEEITQIPNWDANFYFADGHMSAAGNQYLADYIYRHVFEEPNQISDFSYHDGTSTNIGE